MGRASERLGRVTAALCVMLFPALVASPGALAQTIVTESESFSEAPTDGSESESFSEAPTAGSETATDTTGTGSLPVSADTDADGQLDSIDTDDDDDGEPDSSDPDDNGNGTVDTAETATATEPTQTPTIAALTLDGLCVSGERAVWQVTNSNPETVMLEFDDESRPVPLSFQAASGETFFEANDAEPLEITQPNSGPVLATGSSADAPDCTYQLTLAQRWQDASGQAVTAPQNRGDARLGVGDETVGVGETVDVDGGVRSYTVRADPPSGWRLVEPSGDDDTRQGTGQFPLQLTDAAAPLTHELVYELVDAAAAQDPGNDIPIPSRIDTGAGGTSASSIPAAAVLALAGIAGGGTWLTHKYLLRS